MREYSVIGKRLPRVDASVKVTGEAKYTVDMMLPGMLSGKILRSPYAHAKILNIDTSKAERLPGVRAVITGNDTPKIPFSITDSPQCPADKFPLALNKVRFIGDEVAAVAAIDEDVAEEALDLIKVDYEELPAVFDPEDAMKPDAPQIHDHAEGNISFSCLRTFGDVEKDFEDSDYIREDKFTFQSIAHCALEPHCCIASFDASEKLTLWSSTQSVHDVQFGLAKTLNMREGYIRVIKPYVGGAFGGKCEMMTIEPSCALLSQKTAKPVKIVLTREETFIGTRLRHRGIYVLKTGVKKDGTIMARYGKSIYDGGGYNSVGMFANLLNNIFLNLVYKFSSVQCDTYRVFTNNPIAGAMRGFGSPQTYYAVESHMDMIAEDLEMDPVEFRLKNALQPNSITLNKLVINSCGLTQCIESAKEKSNWNDKRGKMPRGQGIGMGCGGFVSGTGTRMKDSDPYSACYIRANDDGTVNLAVGAADIGQGSDTTLCQIVAEELGIKVEDIKIVSADTEITPIDQGSYSSRLTVIAGNAAIDAAAKIKKRLFEVVAEKLEVPIDILEAKDRQIRIKEIPDKGISFAEAVVLGQKSDGGRPVVSDGHYDAGKLCYPDFETGAYNEAPNYSFFAHTAEVVVDEETGFVKVGSIIPAHDLGRAINPMAAEGQLEGSVQIGLGYGLSEQIVWDKGKVLNPSFLDYEVPTALDMPEIEPILIETNDPEGPFGAKECGEGAASPVAPAINNAVCNAIGIRIKEIPLTPDKILKELERKEAK